MPVINTTICVFFTKVKQNVFLLRHKKNFCLYFCENKSKKKSRMNNRLIYLLILLVGIFLGYIWGNNSFQTKENVRDTSSSELKNSASYSKKDLEKRRNSKYKLDNKSRTIPSKVLEVLDYIKNNRQAPEGYVGGRKFKNLENLLPKQTEDGKRINYQEWDVNPHREGKNRGAERLVTGDNETAFYTNDHYQSFQKIK
jgi:ribonuclease T1